MPTGAAFAHAGGCGGIFLKNSIEKSAEPAAGRIRLYEEPVYLAALVMLGFQKAASQKAVTTILKGFDDRCSGVYPQP
jgi:Holliday junction resolvasome RuvABC DNA-binding subunit